MQNEFCQLSVFLFLVKDKEFHMESKDVRSHLVNSRSYASQIQWYFLKHQAQLAINGGLWRICGAMVMEGGVGTGCRLQP